MRTGLGLGLERARRKAALNFEGGERALSPSRGAVAPGEVFEDPQHHTRVGNQRDQPEASVAAGTAERVHAVLLSQQRRP
jgi:hypothetical protein